MFPPVMSNSDSVSEEASGSPSVTRIQDFSSLNPMMQTSVANDQQQPQKTKKTRSLAGNPDPDAEVIALSPRTLLATNRFVCDVCNKGFQRDQNLQLHRRGHNLPWKLKLKNSKETRKKAYVCPEPTCVHHHPSRALGDLTGIKKHFCRKHGEKKWKCDKCSKIYAVQSDWKAHSKICGTREYKCDCGTLFSRRDSLVSHRAFCDALAQESARLSAGTQPVLSQNSDHNTTIRRHPSRTSAATTHSILQPPNPNYTTTITTHRQPLHFNPQKDRNPPPPPPPPLFHQFSSQNRHFPFPWDPQPQNPNPNFNPGNQVRIKCEENLQTPISSPLFYHERSMMTTSHIVNAPSTLLSATALLQKAAMVGSVGCASSTMANLDMHVNAAWPKSDDDYTRDFLGLVADNRRGGAGGSADGNVPEALSFQGGVGYPPYERDHSRGLKYHGFGFGETCSGTWGNC